MALLFLLPLFLLLAPLSLQSFTITGVLYVICSYWLQRKNYRNLKFQAKKYLCGAFIAIFLGYLFYLRWFMLSKVVDMPSEFYIKYLIICSIVISLLSIPGIVCILVVVWRHILKWRMFSKENKTYTVFDTKLTMKEILILLVISVITISFCSTSSPLYALNIWVDSNAFFTVGKSMLHGLVPYKDLFEHKGPIVYILHTFAAMISFDSFIGIYYIECLCCWIFCIFVYRFLRLFFDSDIISIVPLFAGIIYSSLAFDKGDSVEEFSLPLLMYGLYILTKACVSDNLPKKMEFLWIGITSACILWMKYTLLSFYFGWIVILSAIAIRQKRKYELFKGILSLTSGVSLVTIPLIAYFMEHTAIYDWLNVYFYDNIFLYSINSEETTGIIQNIAQGFNGILYSFFAGICLVVLGLLWCIAHGHKWILIEYILMGIFLLISVYGGGRCYVYYALAFGAISVFGLLPLWDVYLNWTIRKKTNCTASILFTLCFICLIGLSPNINQIQYKKMDYPQYQVNEVIKNSGIISPSLLNYGFLDGGFYTATGIVPNVKYFYKSNVPLDDIMQQQNIYINDGQVDFIIANQSIKNLKFYQLVNTFHDTYENQTYYLYQHLDNN